MNREDKLTGCFHTTASGRASYEIYLATPDFLQVAANVLRVRFGFSLAPEPLVGFDQVITDCERDGVKLLLGWDNWSGFYVMADAAAGDNLVKEFGTYLNTLIEQEEYDRYIHRW
jgi:hypothetical protein